MSYYSYEARFFFRNNFIKFLFGIILILVSLLFYNSLQGGYDKRQFKRFIAYDEGISQEVQSIVSKVNTYSTEYYENKRSKKQYIGNLKDSAKELEKLYDSYRWNKGDEVTKEMFIIKKQIMLNYVHIYANKARAIESNVNYSELEDMNYITSLMDRYNSKNRFQRQRYDINF